MRELPTPQVCGPQERRKPPRECLARADRRLCALRTQSAEGRGDAAHDRLEAHREAQAPLGRARSTRRAVLVRLSRRLATAQAGDAELERAAPPRHGTVPGPPRV